MLHAAAWLRHCCCCCWLAAPLPLLPRDCLLPPLTMRGLIGRQASSSVTPIETDGGVARAAEAARTAGEAALWTSSGWLEMASGGNACDVKASGAVGDNITDDTHAIQKAIDDCRKAHPLAAVVVLSGPAAYRITASVELGSNLTLLIDKETTLFSAKTPPTPCNDTVARKSGTTCDATPYTPMPIVQNPRCPTLYWPTLDTSVLCGSNLTNIAILGADQNTSVVDGGGVPWYNRWSGGLDGPRLFEVAWSTNITLAHATFQNSAGWTVHPTFCDGVLAHHIRILNPRWVGNTDGFDPDSCTDVRLHDSIIDTGDDGISIKSGNVSVEGMAARAGRNIHGTKQTIQRPTKNVHIYRTKILSRNFCLGSATYGGIFNLMMEACELGDVSDVPLLLLNAPLDSLNFTARLLSVFSLIPPCFVRMRGLCRGLSNTRATRTTPERLSITHTDGSRLGRWHRRGSKSTVDSSSASSFATMP